MKAVGICRKSKIELFIQKYAVFDSASFMQVLSKITVSALGSV